MKNESRNTKMVIAMISISLAGLMVVQLLLLNMAWKLKEQAFERNVVTALTISAQKLEVGEITGNALDFFYKIDQIDSLQTTTRRMKFFSSEAFLLHDDPYGEELAVVLPDSGLHTSRLTVVMSDNRTDLIQRIVDDLATKPLLPIEERLHKANLDSLLRNNLDAVGIVLVPELYVFSTLNDSLIMTSSNANPHAPVTMLKKSGFKSRLFPLDPTPETYEIVLQFPGQRSFLLKQIWPLLGASIIFMAVIIAAFVLMLSASRQQYRFAGHIVDFINNMTHEFKTPISTVALASEAIARPDILQQPEALKRYNGMIRDENNRMRQQVERILQIAQLEKGDFQLNLTSVDTHYLARNTAENFALQIENQGGQLNLDLSAQQSFVNGDPVHLANVLANLVDNAIKYSPEKPTLSLATSNKDGQLIIVITDNGIGIKRGDHDRVFEKYYRCPTGNRHDVKGFGLGLSYVRLLVEAHGGHVNLDGTVGKGTRVVLRLPLDQTRLQSGSSQ